MELPATRQTGEALTSLILPTYNPGAAIAATWDALHGFLESADGRWEVIFVSDGSTDGTTERLTTWTKSSRMPVRVLSLINNRGKGYAVRQGLLAARGEFRVFTDVDLAYGFDEVLQLGRALWAGHEVAIASRCHPDSEMVLPPRLIGYLFRRHLQSEVFGALARQLLPITQRDTQAGLKGMSAEVAERIVPRLRCDGFGFDCEMLTACARLGIEVQEVPVRVRYRDAETTTGWSTVRRMIGDLFRIRRDWRLGAPEPLPRDKTVLEFSAPSVREEKRAA
jgi:dolichyl-phosphate beta-glucosyltransferase